MNMIHRVSFIGLFFFSTLTTFGQVSGNQAFNDYGDNRNIPSSSRIYLTDSTFFINASVLINVIADNYVATFGVAESATTLKDANTKIDDRIQKFISALKKIGVLQADIYVDMTTQTRLLDYKDDERRAQEQFISGFEQKKNVIVKFKDVKDLDKMVIAASEYGIYDLVKVDYIVTEPNKIYMQLFQTAMELLNNKKDLYVKATNIKLKKTSKISSESFYSLVPPELYKSYTPKNISTYINYDRGSRKDLPESTTYYYDHINYSTFDKVINPVVIEPTVEFILLLQLKFDIEKE
jgi:uncharacterized protein YggE